MTFFYWMLVKLCSRLTFNLAKNCLLDDLELNFLLDDFYLATGFILILIAKLSAG